MRHLAPHFYLFVKTYQTLMVLCYSIHIKDNLIKTENIMHKNNDVIVLSQNSAVNK